MIKQLRELSNTPRIRKLLLPQSRQGRKGSQRGVIRKLPILFLLKLKKKIYFID
jgi:hypothetical protein